MIIIVVIELSGVQFGLKSYVWFQKRMSAQRENCHFIRSILKLHNLIQLAKFAKQ